MWIELEIIIRERQIPYDVTHMQNLRNKTEECRGGKRREVKKPQKTLFYYFLKFIFEREIETEHKWGRGRERGRYRIQSSLQALSCQHRAQCRVGTHEPGDHDLNWSQTLNRLSCPGAPKETLNDREQTMGWWKEVSGRWAKWVVGTKEGICCLEQWVLYVSYESLNSTPETNIAL